MVQAMLDKYKGGSPVKYLLGSLSSNSFGKFHTLIKFFAFSWTWDDSINFRPCLRRRNGMVVAIAESYIDNRPRSIPQDVSSYLSPLCHDFRNLSISKPSPVVRILCECHRATSWRIRM
jgi:hypothetical protein